MPPLIPGSVLHSGLSLRVGSWGDGPPAMAAQFPRVVSDARRHWGAVDLFGAACLDLKSQWHLGHQQIWGHVGVQD